MSPLISSVLVLFMFCDPQGDERFYFAAGAAFPGLQHAGTLGPMFVY